MKFICDAVDRGTWFRIETDGEAAAESLDMNHAVEKYFLREKDKAAQSYRPISVSYIERDIALDAHIQRTMPLFLTLRDGEGKALATAMLPPGARDDNAFRIMIVGPGNGDPYPGCKEAIAALGRHFGLSLDRDRCFPYKRGSS